MGGLLERILSLFQPKVISPLQDQGDYKVMFVTPTPTATPSPSPTPIPTPTLIPNAPHNPYMGLLKKYFDPSQVNNASNIMFKESSFNPNTVNANADQYNSKDYGLFQTNDYWQKPNMERQGLTPQDMLNPETAIKFAAWLQSQQGWKPWSSAPSLGL